MEKSGPGGTQAERLVEDASRKKNWKRWVRPGASTTVREDRPSGAIAGIILMIMLKRAYRWGEDAPGITIARSDSLCAALWNGRDSILKERLFGLTNREEITARMSRSTTLPRFNADSFLT